MDLGEIRFAVSPLNELTLSLRTWRDPGRYPLHLPWLRATGPARATLDGEMLEALTNADLWTPDFLSPRPVSPLTAFAGELARIRDTPTAVVREHLAAIHPTGLPPVLSGPTGKVLRRISAALAEYWATCFEPWWPRMRAVLEADIVYRGRMIARLGMAEMLGDVSPRVRLIENVVQFQPAGEPHQLSTVYRRRRHDPSSIALRQVRIDSDHAPGATAADVRGARHRDALGE
ncbi:hypothetical protein [Jatrophihabitans sp. GAS493]|uniref:hypothetical protein n=1 Tax=Jatrophihabitans sp. GAS493 TaxID=1907575 RepID=UPI0018D53AC4|nr:hypothetical protein [Jatrophihabitans sp. GAS493]